jgi:hypothetical protein
MALTGYGDSKKAGNPSITRIFAGAAVGGEMTFDPFGPCLNTNWRFALVLRTSGAENMRLSIPLVAAALALSFASARLAAADDLSVKQSAPPGWHGQGVVVTPESSVPKPEDAGKRMHTNTKIYVPT